MKNINNIEGDRECCKGGCKGLFCFNNSINESTSCPLCENWISILHQDDYMKQDPDDKDADRTHDEWICQPEDLAEGLRFKDSVYEFYHCDRCRILFKSGCYHYSSSSGIKEEDIDNAHFIGKWSIIGHPKFNPEIIFYGMPQFESIEEYLEIRKYIKVVEEICFAKHSKCIQKDARKFKTKCELLPDDNSEGKEVEKIKLIL